MTLESSYVIADGTIWSVVDGEPSIAIAAIDVDLTTKGENAISV